MGSTPVGISASRISSVLGLSPYRSPVDTWVQLCEERAPGFCARRGLEPPKRQDSAPLRWGLAFEGQVIRLAEERAETMIVNRERLFRSPDGILSCHLDGIYTDPEAEAVVLHEGKTTSAWSWRDRWGEPGTDRIPREYQAQVQLQMLLAGATECVVSVLVFPERVDEYENRGIAIDPKTGQLSGGDATAWADVLASMGLFMQYVVPAHPEVQELMAAAARDWWHRYVVTETPPPVESYDDIRRLLPEPRGTVIADAQTARWCAEYGQINDELARIDKRKKELAKLILAPIKAGAERPVDDDSVEALILRDGTGHKLASYSKSKAGKLTFRCGG